MIKAEITVQKEMSFWQLVFSQSKVNGASYEGEELPIRPWSWPKDTYLQRRLQHVRSQEPVGSAYVSLSSQDVYKLVFEQFVHTPVPSRGQERPRGSRPSKSSDFSRLGFEAAN